MFAYGNMILSDHTQLDLTVIDLFCVQHENLLI